MVNIFIDTYKRKFTLIQEVSKLNKISKVQCYSRAIRTTIPMAIAKYLEIKNGDSVNFTILKNGSIVLTKVKEK